MRPEFIVPRDEESQLMAHAVQIERDKDFASALGFHGADEPFDNGNAAVLSDRAEPWLDLPSFAPFMVGVFACILDGLAL